MVRRSRRRRPRTTPGVQLIQIMGLVLILVMILLFRDQIGAGAGAFFDQLGSEDVQLPEEGGDAGPSATTGSLDDSPDAGAAPH